MRRAWYVNLDAELELASQGPYQSRRAIAGQIAERRELLQMLTRDEPLLYPGQPFRAHDFDVVLPWCPTPCALEWLSQMSARTPQAPSVDVLRTVNRRTFLFSLGIGLAGRRWLSPGDDPAWLASPPDGVEYWRLKREFGFAAKGQRVFRCPGSADDWRWVHDSLRKGGVLCEPNVQIVEEYSAHGYIDRDSEILGQTCRQVCDDRGRVLRVEPLLEDSRLLSGIQRDLAAALRGAGYFGPFGFDAFSFACQNGLEMNLLSDVNARFTLGWSVGMAGNRDAALDAYARNRDKSV
ncbi:MAG TPA: hypothetical protein VHM70_15710 [Polyangiaceae bacterium]|jgi:hypothetical protein|nr:hypothetical protein [Polyangiaceae bacterium]